MNRIKSTLMSLFLLFVAVGSFAVVPGGAVDGMGGIGERTPSMEQQGPIGVPAATGLPMQDIESLQAAQPAAPAEREVSAVAKAAQNNTPSTVSAEPKGNEAGSVTVEGQNRKRLRMDRNERKAMRARFRANKNSIKDQLRQARENRKKGKASADDTELLLLVILSILLPPLAVYLFEGSITNNFWIDLILTLLGWLPGIIFALIIILR